MPSDDPAWWAFSTRDCIRFMRAHIANPKFDGSPVSYSLAPRRSTGGVVETDGSLLSLPLTKSALNLSMIRVGVTGETKGSDISSIRDSSGWKGGRPTIV